jgi:hypothetical protein
MTEIHRFDLAVLSACQSDGLVVVEFAEEGDATVARPDGRPARRTWTLRGIDEWRRSPDGWSVCNGEDLEVSRALDGRPMTDQEDPIGWHRWAALYPR